MFPPVEESVLQNNPEFASLYKTLTTTVLNPDGSTRDDGRTKERAAAKEILKEARVQATKEHILARAIASVGTSPPADTTAPPASKPGPTLRRPARLTATRPAASHDVRPAGGELPQELLDLLALLPPLLEAGGVLGGSTPSGAAPHLTAEEMDLLLTSSPFCHFPQHLPRLAALVSEELQAAALGVARVVHPSTNASYLHRTVPSLATDVADLQKRLADTKASLAQQERPAVLSATLDCLDQLSGTGLAALLRALEAKHGVVARSLELQAMDVSLAAQQAGHVEAPRTLAAAQAAVYGGPSAEVEAALTAYSEHLRDSTIRLRETVREQEALLEEYGVAVDKNAGQDGSEDAPVAPHGREKESAMRELARRHRDMSKQVADIQSDLARLKLTQGRRS